MLDYLVLSPKADDAKAAPSNASRGGRQGLGLRRPRDGCAVAADPGEEGDAGAAMPGKEG